MVQYHELWFLLHHIDDRIRLLVKQLNYSCSAGRTQAGDEIFVCLRRHSHETPYNQSLLLEHIMKTLDRFNITADRYTISYLTYMEPSSKKKFFVIRPALCKGDVKTLLLRSIFCTGFLAYRILISLMISSTLRNPAVSSSTTPS